MPPKKAPTPFRKPPPAHVPPAGKTKVTAAHKATPEPGSTPPNKKTIDPIDKSILSAPKRPTTGPFNAAPKFAAEAPGHVNVEPWVAPSTIKPPNASTGKVLPKKGSGR